MTSGNCPVAEDLAVMTKEEVAEVLRCKPSMVPRFKGLKKTRIGNGRGKARYRKQDVIEYINSRVEREEVIENAGQQKERHRKMGVPSLPPWQELQKTRLGHSGGGI
jgi:hypothetical protein